MKKIFLLSFSVFFCFVSLFSQDNESTQRAYLLNAVDVLSKLSGHILIPTDTIMDENGIPKTIHYLVPTWAEGSGLNKTIRCGFNLSSPGKGFYNVDFPKEVVFPVSTIRKSVGGYSSFRFDYMEYEIKQYHPDNKISEVRYGLRRLVKNTHAEEGGFISYGKNGNGLTYNGFEIISKANPKDRRIRKEMKRFPNREMDFKVHSQEGRDILEYNSFYLSTSKSNFGNRTQENYFKFSIDRTGEILKLKKEEFTSSGNLKAFSLFEYVNYSLVKSETFNANNTPLEKVIYTYGENGFPKTRERFSANGSDLKISSNTEFFYDEKESSEEGEFPYKPWEIRTDYNEDGRPVMQQKTQGRMTRRYFENGQWTPWEAPLY